jgi:Protein of unknown function (DUF3575)
MKKYIILLVSLLTIVSLQAQEAIVVQQTPKVANSLFRVNILAPGLTFEKSISEKNTLALDVNLALFYIFSSSRGSRLIKTPFTRLQFRHYYNLEKRVNKGKNILNNSGNYVALQSSYYFKSLNDDFYIDRLDGVTLGAAWGMQRTYKSGLNININTGLGYNLSDKKTYTVQPILNFTIGWIFFK